MTFIERSEDSDHAVAVEPVWCNAKRTNISNIVMLGNLFKSTRAHLYEKIVEKVLASAKSSVTPECSAAEPPSGVGFERVRIAGDGRCGWRCFLAAGNIDAYKAVPRKVFNKSMWKHP